MKPDTRNQCGGRRALKIIALLLLCSCASSSEKDPASLAPRPQPILIEDETPPILVEKIIYRIPSGARIGGYYRFGSSRELSEITYNAKFSETEEFNIEISDRMTGLGYNAIDPTAGIFTDGEVKARFRLVGVVSNLDIKTYIRISRQETLSQRVTLEMELRVYDALTQSVVYRESFSGKARAKGSNASGLAAAIMDAMEFALADTVFVHSIISNQDAVAIATETITLPKCEPGTPSLPKDLPKVATAVVGVRLGSQAGSGVIISPVGHVLTAAHVVAPDRTPTVALSNGLTFEATVEALDKPADVALLKIPGSSHQCVVLRASDPIELGSEIYAVGSPLTDELTGTVTRGIVSGHPTFEGQSLIQTDAAVNSGNSGGPIFDKQGQIVGIVTSKLFGFGVEGVAFAVPPETIREKLGLVAE